MLNVSILLGNLLPLILTQSLTEWGSAATSPAGKEESDEGIIDVILCPACPGVAPSLDTSRYWGYVSQWNLLDYPALVFPVTTVDPALDERDEGYEPKNEQDRYNHELCKFYCALSSLC